MSQSRDTRRLVVLEVNEIPLRVIRTAVDSGRAPNLGSLVTEGSVAETTIEWADGDRYLYPSQTWATVATGVDYEEHQVYWYGDPKPAEYPLYWESVAGGGASVGFVGTLHSGEKWQRFDNDRVCFALSDCFAGSDETRPARYRRGQRANIDLAQENGRNSSLRTLAGSAAGLASLLGLGVRRSTAAEVARLATDVASRRVPRERLRTAQHLLMFDIFEHLARRHDPDLAIYFTNHVASMMHRYWYALYPDDWDRELYPESWKDRYADEVLHAVELLDRSIGRLVPWCRDTGRSLALVSSMGQQANLEADVSRKAAAVLRDPTAFSSVLGLNGEHRPVRAMVPTQSWEFADEKAAAGNAAELRTGEFRGGELEVDVVGPVLSVTYHLDPEAAEIGVPGRTTDLTAAGFEIEPISDHNSGIHHPTGTFLLWNSDRTLPPQMDLTEVAPRILGLLGTERAPHHRSLAVGR